MSRIPSAIQDFHNKNNNNSKTYIIQEIIIGYKVLNSDLTAPE